MAKKEHWAKKLKRELHDERRRLREVVLRPDGDEATMIKAGIIMEDKIQQMIWFGSYGGDATTNGIQGQLKQQS